MCRKHGLSQAVYYKWRDKFVYGWKKGLMNSVELSLVNPDTSELEEYEKVIGRQTIEIQILKKICIRFIRRRIYYFYETRRTFDKLCL